MDKLHVAIDLGGSHGRVSVGGANLDLDNVYNFETRYGLINNYVYWEILSMFQEIKTGLKLAYKKYGSKIVSIGFDTWGVDYGLLDESGSLLTLPSHFRDPRTLSVIDEVIEKVGGEEKIFEATGIDKESFNTIYQLYETKKRRPQMFSCVKHYLSIPDLFGYWFTGIMQSEKTHASTTQLYSPFEKDWNWEIIDSLGFPRTIFSPLVDSGTIRGPLLPSISKELGFESEVFFVNCAEHDTASAVSTIMDGTEDDTLFISSGTWSLVGCFLDNPIVTKEAYKKRFTNEATAKGTIRILRNVMGMLIQHECIKYWKSQGKEISLKELDEMTIKEMDFDGVINPLDDVFLPPNSIGGPMVDRIDSWCIENNQSVPTNEGQYMVSIYRGLAETYKDTLLELQKLTNMKFSKIHIVGGASKNWILNQMTSDACNLNVIAGPSEASSLGNILMQLMAMGEIQNIGEGLKLLKDDMNLKHFIPSK
jgi:sugar (pentulose or hexulose) kinase